MKIYIESNVMPWGNKIEKKYRLKTDCIQMPLISISGLFSGFVKKFNLIDEPNYAGNVKLDEEKELTTLFCDMLNAEIEEKYFTIGSADECVYSYVQAQYNTRNRIEELLKKEVSQSDETSTRLEKEINELKSSLDYPISDIFDHKSNGYKAIEEIKKIERKHRLYIYSKYVDYLLENKMIECNHPLPLIFNSTIETIGINYSYYGNNFVDLYPINLAIESENLMLLKKIINYGGYKFSYNDHCSVNRITTIILFILKYSKTEEDISYIYKFFDLYPKDYEWIFKTNVSQSLYGPNAEYISGDGNSILIEAYKAALRINSISALRTLLSKQRHWLMKRLLQCADICNPKTYVNEEDFVLNEEMMSFIKEHIGRHLHRYRDYDPHEHGIWGYDARTGRPIKESDLYV